MNQLLRGSLYARGLVVSGVAARLSGVGFLEPTAAATAATSWSHWQWRDMSSEPTETASHVEEVPKKKRGRPKKVKPEDEQAAAAPAAIAGEAAPSEEPALSSPSPSPSHAVETSQTPSAAPSSSSSIEQPSLKTVDKNNSIASPIRSYGGRRGPRFVQGLATVTAPTSIPEQWHSDSSIKDIAPGSQGPVGKYIDFPEGTLPESAASFFHDPALSEERVRQSDYGCKGVSAEFEAYGKRSLLYRTVTQNLFDAAALTTGAPRRLFVDGWTGAGKSVALYTLAAAARAAGWVVMYIPSATLLVQGGRFYRSDIEGDVLWDTPEAARHVLNAITHTHGEALASMKAADGSGKSLADVAAEGLGSTVARVIVEAAIAVKDGLMAHDGGDGVRTMVVIDDYNALYSHTQYHEPMHAFHRRPIASDELRMATAFRVLERNGVPSTGAGVVVAAPTFGGGVSKSLRLPRAPDALTVRVPRFGVDEVAVVAAMLAGTGAVPEVPSEHVIRRALALTNGNAKELREFWNVVMVDEDPVGLSLGYKAMAAARVRYATTLP